jgi:hypothetical protein
MAGGSGAMALTLIMLVQAVAGLLLFWWLVRPARVG